MNSTFRFFPEEASGFAGRVDSLFLFLLGVATFFTLLILVAICAFVLKYRRGSRASRTRSGFRKYWVLEIVWSVIPLALTMVMFAWGAQVYFDEHQPPPDATEINVVGKQWMWKLQQPGGRQEINELHVPVGEPVRLRMISEDVIHSFYVPAFRLKMDVLPGRFTSLWFTATRTGEYHLFCAEYCGTSHSQMRGRIVVMSRAEYTAWLAGSTNEPAEVIGKRLFEQMRCDSCHMPPRGTARRCPPLEGFYGSQVLLTDGRTVKADESYIRQSIVEPKAKIVRGYEPLMPTYQGQVSEEQILQIIAYLKSLAPSAAAPSAVSTPPEAKTQPPESDTP